MYRAMNRHMLDDRRADRLLSGAVPPDDAPPDVVGLAALLRSAAAPAPSAAIDQKLIAAMVAAISAQASEPTDKQRTSRRPFLKWIGAGAFLAASSEPTDKQRTPRRPVLQRARVGGLVAGALLFGGTGVALAGGLPGGMQSVAATILSKVGISVPNGHPATGQPSPHVTASPAPKGPNASGPAKYGLCNAFFSGQGGTNGNRDNSVAFQNLQQEAQAAGQSIQEFCASATPGGKGSPDAEHSQGSNQGSGQGHGQGSGSGQDKGQGQGSGHNSDGNHDGPDDAPAQSHGQGHAKGNDG